MLRVLDLKRGYGYSHYRMDDELKSFLEKFAEMERRVRKLAAFDRALKDEVESLKDELSRKDDELSDLKKELKSEKKKREKAREKVDELIERLSRVGAGEEADDDSAPAEVEQSREAAGER